MTTNPNQVPSSPASALRAEVEAVLVHGRLDAAAQYMERRYDQARECCDMCSDLLQSYVAAVRAAESLLRRCADRLREMEEREASVRDWLIEVRYEAENNPGMTVDRMLYRMKSLEDEFLTPAAAGGAG